LSGHEYAHTCRYDGTTYAYDGPIPHVSLDILFECKFTGKERDAESGLDEFSARYYASSMGRFMIPDWAAKATTVPYASFGDPQTLNLYSYVRNSPLSHADADGHCLEDACIAEGAALLALYAYTTSPAGQQVIRNGINGFLVLRA
jgi:RHS repeat-associated protein